MLEQQREPSDNESAKSHASSLLRPRPMRLERPPFSTLDLPHLLSGFRGVYIVNAVVAFLFVVQWPLEHSLADL